MDESGEKGLCLHDLRVQTVLDARAPVCRHVEGESFGVIGENLVFEGAGRVSIHALAAILPPLPGRPRPSMARARTPIAAGASASCARGGAGFPMPPPPACPNPAAPPLAGAAKSVETTELRPGHRMSRILKGGWQLAGDHGEVSAPRAIADIRRRGAEVANRVVVHTKLVPDLARLADLRPDEALTGR